MMEEKDIFGMALGLSTPWFVKSLEFSSEKNRLDITLDFAKGSRFSCPVCGMPCAVHDAEKRTWRHLNFFQHSTHLHARLPRVECPDHKVKTVEVSWARPGAGFTLLFEALVMMLAKNGMAANAIARMVSEHDTRIWRILNHYVEEARSRMDCSKVTHAGMDETSKAKGHKYVTLFMDFVKRRILFATEGKDSATVKAFKADLVAHNGDPKAVVEFCLDMSPAFQKGIQEEFPHAQMTFD